MAELDAERAYKVTVGRGDYAVELQPDLAGKGYVVECPALPGCVSQGDTVEEVLSMIRDVSRKHLSQGQYQRQRL